MSSPYAGVPSGQWLEITRQLVAKHPLTTDEIVQVVLGSWDAIFDSRMGSKGFRISVDIFPKPQIMGFLLHELIPLELQARHPDHWCGERSGEDKDLVYIPDNFFSIEVKTSSNPSHIFGNRSYAQQTTENKKAKSGYYLAVNFENFKKRDVRPRVILLRFGWIDSTDWIGQHAATGQQSRLPPSVENGKLLKLFSVR